MLYCALACSFSLLLKVMCAKGKQMLRGLPHILMKVVVLGLILVVFARSGMADEEATNLVGQLAEANFREKAKIVDQLAGSDAPYVASVLTALQEGRLYVHADGSVVVGVSAPEGLKLINPVTGDMGGVVNKSAVQKIRVNNLLRGRIEDALARMALSSPDEDKRLEAAEAAFRAASADSLLLVESVLAVEENEEIAAVLAQAKAAIILSAGAAPEEELLASIQILRDRGDQIARGFLSRQMNSENKQVADAATRAVTSIDKTLAVWSGIQNAWYGMSLGSVLLLAATGLAITFGVMGVINMAHGEMVMLGAYTTYMVQQIIAVSAPGLMEWSLVIAVPAAFLVSGAVGVGIERSVIRFLYGRPLETLLATWGVSLILQQTVRTIFGPTNKQVISPSWMSGAFELGHMSITYNRLTIIIFALVVFTLLMLLMKRTFFGLQTRAVTQNRPMAASMGIRTELIDMLTFGLGSGIAGIAGVALSQIDNVSPNLGQSYIIDSFMVVVFGGASSLWGTLVGGFTLGIANKFLEPYAGAVLGKILILVFIILFIQRRPRGLFALKGRGVEA